MVLGLTFGVIEGFHLYLTTRSHTYGHQGVYCQRNDRVFKTKDWSPIEVISTAERAFLEFQSVITSSNPSQTNSGAISSNENDRWNAPPLGFIKVNCDATKPQGDTVGGLGIIFRDHNGCPLKALSLSQVLSFAIQGEALAIREALMQARELGITNLLVESDNKEIISFIEDPNRVPPLDVAVVVEDVRELCSTFVSVSFLFVPRAMNVIADALVRKALSIMCMTDWPITTPWLDDLCLSEATGCTHDSHQ
ncbi:uncharacterized protein LOC122662983 [Telopea speciosissima]|uniref:uncharacterized protein LOC122662983 n=1 Tax=Telopea speciosissima TaxID=54955 RepID=UPI001CC43393|nr:uncharacterized protein LOC122662983 [Telopea speciosissima]